MLLEERLKKQGGRLSRFRGVLPLVVLAFGVYDYMLTELSPGRFALEGTRWEYLYEMGCLLVSLFGLAIRIYTVGHTPDRTSGRNTAEGQVADELNTTGVYSVMRNPLYVGNFFMWLGIALLTADWRFVVAFVLFCVLYYERIIYAEDRFLLVRFGESYRRWAEATPCVFPRWRNFRKPVRPFSLRKVLRQEKNGLLALLLIFSLLDCAGEWIGGKEPKYGWLLAAAGLCAVGYAVLKYLKHRTTRLDGSPA